jgi:asparagine synthase (glutamine-hydrolysing)
MPGITGILGAGKPDENKILLSQMASCMLHEPFYSSGMYINEQLGLWVGWVSLKGSFSDCMPVWNEKKDKCIIFAGEDYTDPEDIEALKTKGHEFEDGNASYLVHLYEEIGLSFIEKLNGRFSGVIVDLLAKRVLLFNDRYGLNRIYYHECNEGLFFSSEAKSILKVLPGLRQLNNISLAETFSLGCVLQNRTLFAGINLLPGGSLWDYLPGKGIKKEYYFRPSTWESQDPLGEIEYYSKLRETWSRILPRYARGKERVAMSLTGGKDTRMILAWLKPSPGAMPCYTFGGMYRESADVKLARQIAKICQQPHQVIRMDSTFFKEFPSLAEKTVYVTDGIMDVSGAPDLFVNKVARRIAPIRLTGNYGQEILHSYIAFKPNLWGSFVLEKEFLRLMEHTANTYNKELLDNRLSFVAFKQLPWYHYSRLSVELSQLTLRSPYLDNEIVSLAYRGPRKLTKCIELQLRLMTEGDQALGKVATDLGILYKPIPIATSVKRHYQEITHKAEYAYDYGMPQLLARIDHILEPFHLERIFLGRHKFYHFRIWYRSELSGYIKEILLDPRSFARSYINRKNLENIVMAHIKGKQNCTSEIHRILTAELTQRQFVD